MVMEDNNNLPFNLAVESNNNIPMKETTAIVNEGEEEKTQINYRGIKAMPYIIGNEIFEKLGTIGLQSNLLVYLTSVFNMNHIVAATIVNVFNGTANFATLIGAFLCDTYFGRYKTLGFATVASVLGLSMIALTAVFKQLHPLHCGAKEREYDQCRGTTATAGQLAFLFSGFALTIIGAGGIRPCNLAFGADQFDPNKESGKRGINSFFNWYFFTVTFAQMVSFTLVVYLQSDVSWGIGLAIPAIFMFVSCLFFFIGTKIYVIVKPQGSPLESIAQVIVSAIRKRKLVVSPVQQQQQPWLSLFNYIPPKSINSKLPYTQQFRFLDKAAIITAEDKINPNGTSGNPWRLCSIQQVEEAKCVFRVMPIWAAAMFYHIGILQQQQYVVFQAQQSNRYLGNSKFQVPAATYFIFFMFSMTFFIVIYDRILVPFMRKFTGKEGGITILQRLGTGICLIIPALLVSALVEIRRRNSAPMIPPSLQATGGIRGNVAVSSMSGFWLVPQLAMSGLSEAFAAIGQTEFYYKQFPENMRSFAGSLLFLGIATSSYLNTLLISAVHRLTEGSPTGNWLPEDLNKGRLEYFYFLVMGILFLNACYFMVCAKWYRYKEKEETVSIIKKPDNKTNLV